MEYCAVTRWVLLGVAVIVNHQLDTPSALPVTTTASLATTPDPAPVVPTQRLALSSSSTTSSAFTSTSSPADAAPDAELSSVGPWDNPCSPTLSSDASSAVSAQPSWLSEDLVALFQGMAQEGPSPDQQMDDVIVLLQEAVDLAKSLQDEIFQVYLFGSSARREWLLALAPVIPGVASQQVTREADTGTRENTTSHVTQQYHAISVAMVFLEQCRRDEAQGILRHPALSDAYTQLDTKLLTVLCRLQEVLLATNQGVPRVTRSVMPRDLRSMTRVTRDYIIARDVVSILGDALASLRGPSQPEDV